MKELEQLQNISKHVMREGCVVTVASAVPYVLHGLPNTVAVRIPVTRVVRRAKDRQVSDR